MPFNGLTKQPLLDAVGPPGEVEAPHRERTSRHGYAMTELLGGEAAISPGRDALTIEEFWTGRTVVVAVTGDLDILTTPQLDHAIRSAMRTAPTALIIDLTRVDFLASIGMNLLVATRDEIAPTTRFGVVADSPATSRPMKIIGIDTMIALYQTLGDALDAFAGT